MKSLNILFLLLTIGCSAQDQNSESFFYNTKGQLIFDTTLSITKVQYETWVLAEYNLISCFSKIEFPKVSLANSKKPKSTLIVSFVCDTFDLTDVEVLKDTSEFATAIKYCLKNQGREIVRELKSWSLITSHGNYKGRYYFPINFMLVDFKEQLKTQKAVTIMRITEPIPIPRPSQQHNH
jgi:hypothetical protein